MPELPEVRLSKAKERCTVELRVAPDRIVRVRVKRLGVGVSPGLSRLIFCFDVDGPGVPVVLLAPHETPALEDEDLFAGGCERPQESTPACARPDDDDVISFAHGRGAPLG